MPPFKCLIPSLTMLSRYTSFYSLGPYSVSFQLDYFNDFVCSPVYCLLPSTPSPTPVAFTYPQTPNGGTWKGQNFVCFFLLWTGRTCHGRHARNVQSRSVWMRKVSWFGKVVKLSEYSSLARKSMTEANTQKSRASYWIQKILMIILK